MTQQKDEQFPTISVCIPVYNVDARPLAYALIKQIDTSIELVFIDDCSKQHYKKINNALSSQQITWINLERNVGRSKIRNLFLKYTKHDYLLFIDCDSHIIDSNFLKNYQTSIRANSQVIFGGRVYPKTCPSKEQVLSWTSGRKTEEKNATQRNKNPNHSLKTNNLLIKRTTLYKYLFDERIEDYGHEDTLYGIECQRHKIKIQHIDNPILNAHLDTNAECIEKTETAIKTLIKINNFYKHKKLLYKHIRLLAFAKKIENMHLSFVFKTLYKWRGKRIKKKLINTTRPSLQMLNLYKTLYLFGQQEH